MKKFLDKDEQNVVEICDTMLELINERNLGGVPKCKDKLTVLKRIANGTYPAANLPKTRAKDSQGPKVKEENKAQEYGGGTSNDSGDSGRSSGSEYYESTRNSEKPESEEDKGKVDMANTLRHLQKMVKELQKANKQKASQRSAKRKNLRARLGEVGAPMNIGRKHRGDISEESSESESEIESDSSVSSSEGERKRKSKRREKRRKSRLVARLGKRNFPPMELMVDERITEETLLNIFSTASTVSGYVEAARYSNTRNRKEAKTIARTLDFLLADLGLKEVLKIRASEVLIRRLAAIHEAERTGDWNVASEVEETTLGREMISQSIRRRMLRSARLAKEVSSLRPRIKTERAAREGEGGKE